MSLVTWPIEIEWDQDATPGGLPKPPILTSPACGACRENGRENEPAVLSASQSAPHPLIPFHVCRSHATMLLGEKRITAILGEKQP